MFEEIIKSLAKSDILLKTENIKEFDAGLNSTIFLANSSSGKLIIHMVNSTIEHEYQKLDKKIMRVYAEIKKHSDIPTGDIITSGKLSNKKVFFVTKYIEGTPLGKRNILDQKIMDVYNVKNSSKYITQLTNILLKIHSIKCKGFGYIDVNQTNLTGTYKSWIEYLRIETNRWLENLAIAKYKKVKYITTKEYKEYKQALNDLFEQNKYLMKIKRGSLIHWDINNPGNVLINKGKISGIIDFEWSIIGDPIWDLVLSNEDLQDKYSKTTNMNIKHIKRKLLLYRPLWFLWGTNTHLHRPHILNICLSEFTTGLDKLRKEKML